MTGLGPTSSAARRSVYTEARALSEEFERIHGPREDLITGGGPEADLEAYRQAALQQEQAALCLSGGGIRSASFALGVLQALARARLLGRFDYLSSVSGGGYISGWLLQLLQANGRDVDKVQDALGSRRQAPQVKTLRRYTNYLAPGTSIFSPDIWTGVTLWLRNVTINWMIFLPALLALAIVPLFYADILAMDRSRTVGWLLMLVALACLWTAVFNGARLLPSHLKDIDKGSTSNAVLLRIILPNTLWTILVPIIVGPWLMPVMPLGAISGDAVAILAFVVTLLAGAAAILFRREDAIPLFWENLVPWLIASAASAVVLWAWLNLGISRPVWIIAILGPFAVASAHLILTLVFVALRSKGKRADLDREWLARLSGMKIVPSMIWAGFAFICLVLPILAFNAEYRQPYVDWAVAFWAAAGPIAAYIGKISKDRPGEPQTSKKPYMPTTAMLLTIVALLFGVALFTLLAELGNRITARLWWTEILWMGIGAGAALWLGRKINVNRFSMHGVYRRRLVRGFLGPARGDRAPDPYTDIDPRDNPRLAWLYPTEGHKHGLFPVVNATLNLVSGQDAARAERMAESFTMTPLSCGSAGLLRAEDANAGKSVRGAYVDTKSYAGDEARDSIGLDADLDRGLSLGTAMTISGAAVSPAMGYHSSAATSFLMTLFNVRLGAWLPNPAVATDAQLRDTRPVNALIALAREAMGLTNDRKRDVYLSDGGHFENLGLYEMVRRRCRFLLVIDAGMDPDARFADLGSAVRKCRIDHDTEIVFDPPVSIGSRRKPAEPYVDFAIGTITYPETDDKGAHQTGTLVYMKPSFPDGAPMDVRAYGMENEDFPHQPTGDQFFSESQFEAYRALAHSAVERIIGQTKAMPKFFAHAQDVLKKAGASAQSGPAKGKK